MAGRATAGLRPARIQERCPRQLLEAWVQVLGVLEDGGVIETG